MNDIFVECDLVYLPIECELSLVDEPLVTLTGGQAVIRLLLHTDGSWLLNTDGSPLFLD